MGTISPMKTTFSAGEISPRMHGRIDLEKYANAVSSLIGWIPLLHGPLETAPGFIHVAEAKGPCVLLSYEFNITQGYIIEAGDSYFRFYTNDVRLETLGGPIELETPWTVAQAQSLDFAESGDVQYMVVAGVQPQKLVRTGADSFTLTPLELTGGPFEDENKDKTITITADGVVGSVTLTATGGDLFEEGDVGGLLMLRSIDFASVAAWEPGITVTPGDFRVWSGRVYEAAGGAASTGTIPPVHGEGAEYDGMGAGTDINDEDAGGVLWAYRFDQTGILKITAVATATSATATVQRTLPYLPSGSKVTYRWSFGAFSTRRGWPVAAAIWNGRLFLLKDFTVYASVVGGYEDFSKYNEFGEVSADMGAVIQIPNPNPGRWLVGDEKLQIGTAKQEYILGAASAAEGFGPGNRLLSKQTQRGSAAVRPVKDADGKAIFIDRTCRKVIEYGYDLRRDRFETPDLTRYAEHFGDDEFVELAYQSGAERLIWGVMGTGALSVAAYEPAEEMLGWARRQFGEGLAAKSIATISAPDGKAVQLWAAIELGGVHHVMRMDRIRQIKDGITDIVMVDAALVYEGAAKTDFAAPWLAGREVQIVADGAYIGTETVPEGGTLVLETAASNVKFGIAYPCEWESLDMDGGGDSGPGMFKIKRANRVIVDLLNSLGLERQVQDGPWQAHDPQQNDSPMDVGFSGFTGPWIEDDIGRHDRKGRFKIRRAKPFPSTIRSAVLYAEVEQR